MFFLMIVLFFVFMFFWYLTANQFYVRNNVPKNLKTNGMCTKIISPVFKETKSCCLEYDKIYAYGGLEFERLNADADFKKCIARKGISENASFFIYQVIRFLGTPYVRFPWRWGYAYDFGAGYQKK